MSIARNLAEINERIQRACDSAGRDAPEVTLVAVSKTFATEAILEAYDAGHRHFGESRLQEAQPKIESLPVDIVWHFVGHLQSNKARKAALLCEYLHTLESESQLREIAKAGRNVNGFIEVNIADEPQKTGISTQFLDGFVETVLHYPQVHLTGLMTVGPAVEDPELSRKYFRRTRELAEKAGLSRLSMGMSHDFDVAIQEGATHVRVGTAIFGSRN